VLATGVHGVAVLGAVCLASDPSAAVAKLRALIEARGV
jgi:thiamine monophosphate synthase